ncbi:probable histone-lysine N-methyltransferase PRDM7 [Fukomys damarensis]|uniref:probable histone-lysine N-methyltransferase PRDM7 n=1 Tax=Fukomys damarensis TaxID=885580 RepID=UPI001455689F|nr:probable histone-lysine N-methyltransferase PRDM7 [Fukomys damarensis]
MKTSQARDLLEEEGVQLPSGPIGLGYCHRDPGELRLKRYSLERKGYTYEDVSKPQDDHLYYKKCQDSINSCAARESPEFIKDTMADTGASQTPRPEATHGSPETISLGLECEMRQRAATGSAL